MSQIVMPQAGQSMEEGTIVRWHKAEGESIAKGEVLFEIETDKSVIEVEASESGVLRQILVPEGKTVAIKTPVAELETGNTQNGDKAEASKPQLAENVASSRSDLPTGVVIPVLMPQAGQSMEEGTLVKWRVAVGQMIKKGDVIFDVETDKSVVEVESTEEGRLARIVAAEGAVVPVLVPVAYIAENDADVDAFIAASGGAAPATSPSLSPSPSPSPSPKQVLAPAAPAPKAVPQESIKPAQQNGGRLKVSPAARKAAAERGIDLASVGQGSGPGGRILSSDLPTSAPAKKAAGKAAPDLKPYNPIAPSAAEPVRSKMTPMRKAIARNLLASKQNIPHWYIQRIVDADPMMAFYRAQKAKYPCSVNDVLTLAVSRTIMEFPAFRCQVDGDGTIEFPTVNIGIAVGLEGGLVVPVALGVESMNLRELGAESKRLAETARTSGKIENMGKGVFTISNLGMFGVDQFTAIINPPEAAILAVSAIREDVIVKDGMMRPGKTVSLTLSADHRLIDGVLAAQFMARLKEMLENPEFFLL